MNIQDRVARDHRHAVNIQVHLPAHHHFSQDKPVRFRGVDRADIAAFVQHSYAVRYAHHFFQFMGDDDDRAAIPLHGAQDVKQVLDLLRCQNRGGLVQYQYLSTPCQYLQDLDALFFRYRHGIDFFIQVHLQAKLAAHLVRGAGGLAAAPQTDIFARRKQIHQLEVLMNHTDAQADGIVRRTDMDGPAFDLDASSVRLVNARQHVHQGGLARAVFTQQR